MRGHARTRVPQRVCLRCDAFAAFALQRMLLAEPLRSREEGRTKIRSCMPALDLAVGRELEALPGAAMGFQFQFWLRCVSRHCWKSSREFLLSNNVLPGDPAESPQRREISHSASLRSK